MVSCVLWLFVEQANGKSPATASGKEQHKVLVMHLFFSPTGVPWPSWVLQLLKATSALLASLPLQVSLLQVSIGPPASSPSRLGWNKSSSSTNSGFLYYLLRFPYTYCTFVNKQTFLKLPYFGCAIYFLLQLSLYIHPLPMMETIQCALTCFCLYVFLQKWCFICTHLNFLINVIEL